MMIRCDAIGIPTIVQKWRFDRSGRQWKVKYFDGTEMTFCENEMAKWYGIFTEFWRYEPVSSDWPRDEYQ